ncbi:MAG: hypothetical protein LC745_08585, partial [Planctomycetia bacterium]|nr:hypothetical protein [Planctomycetia bacterium]
MSVHPTTPTRAKYGLAFLGIFGCLTLPGGPDCRAGDGTQVAAASVDYNRDIRPILSEHCFACHGPDKNQRKADLRLDVRESAVALEAIVPGKPDASELVARIDSADPDEIMPPPSSRKPLSPSQKDLLRRWVAADATYAAHWAYTPLARPEVRA